MDNKQKKEELISEYLAAWRELCEFFKGDLEKITEAESTIWRKERKHAR